MKKENQKINIFIPARALEHTCNREFLTLTEKLKWALIRYYFNKDFFNPRYRHPLPSVFLEKFALKNRPLGYAVHAVIKSG